MYQEYTVLLSSFPSIPPSFFPSLPPSQEPEIQGRVRAITSDEDFERELKQVGESLVVVDFKADW